MASTRTATGVLLRTDQALQESAKLKARVEKTLSVSVVIIDRSKQLLSQWPVNGVPAFDRSEQAEQTEDTAPSRAAGVPGGRAENPLEQVSERDFKGEMVRLDGRHFVDCALENCTLEYWGGPVVLEGTHFSGCRFRFGGEAAMTVSMLECFGLIEQQSAGPARSSSATQGSVRVN